MHFAAIAVLLTVGGAGVDWDLETRLAIRFDIARNAERQRVYAADHAAALRRNPAVAVNAADAGGPRQFIIDGARNPELLLPHELFDGLMTALVPDEVQRFRQRELYDSVILRLGLDPDQFWLDMDELSRTYRQLRSAEAPPESICRGRYDALEAARARFGAHAFDRLLYEVIAPSYQISFATAHPNPAALLRSQARGCR